MEEQFSKLTHSSPIIWAESQSIDSILTMLKYLSDNYYNTEKALVDDWVFDSLVDYFNQHSDSPYEYIGAKIDDKNKTKLPCHMGSMDKTKTLEGLTKWLWKQPNLVNEFIISPKIDGTSALIEFMVDSNKINVYTRGDGTEGKLINFLSDRFLPQNIQNNIKTFFDKMNSPVKRFMCRGEMIISNTNFSQFSEVFKSPRSMVNGLTNKKSENETHIDALEFKLFEIIEPALCPYEQFSVANDLGFNVVDFKKLSRENIESDLTQSLNDTKISEILNDYRNTYEYDIDGIIISSNMKYSLPESGNPDYSIAFKINQAGKQTIVRDIEWNVSKHGLLIPTIVFEPIVLGKSKVSRCTGFNGSFIFNNSLGCNSEIRVVLSGEVIPYVCEIISKSSVPKMPSIPYKWNESKVQCEIVGDNPEFEIQRIVNFIKTIKIDNLAEGMVKHLYLNGFTSLDKILLITKADLLKLDRIEEKMANKIIGSINDKIKSPIDLSKIMDGSISFGHGFGEKRCKQIVDKFSDFLEKSPSHEEIVLLPGWSDKSANKFMEGLPILKQFLENNPYLIIKKSAIVQSNLNISKVCITGKRFPEIIKFLNENNVEISSNVTGDIDLLLCENKNSGSSKIKQADKKGKEILSSSEFIDKYNLKN
jgi:DNA ligase (NAD+)